MYALVDCNNFFVSCEKLFRPDLENKPVVVLSNNDGCAISRSEEAKRLGITMGQPWFEIKQKFKHEKIIAFSTNFPLYADISNRIYKILENFSPRCEKYSIDESFLEINIDSSSLTEYGKKIRNTILKWTGIPVGVGIAKTKTLAKLAQHITKDFKEYEKVCNIDEISEKDLSLLFNQIPIEKLWGIGRKLKPKLNSLKIKNVEDLKNADPTKLGRKFSKNLSSIIYELNNIPCNEMLLENINPKQLICSRTFSKTVNNKEELEEIISYLCAHASAKLRKYNMLTNGIRLTISSNRFDSKRIYRNIETNLEYPTNDIRFISKQAKNMLQKIFSSKYNYKKAGILFYHLVPHNNTQLNFFSTISNNSEMLLEAIDTINNSYGYGTLHLLNEGIFPEHIRNAQLMSPRYTTQIDSLYNLY